MFFYQSPKFLAEHDPEVFRALELELDRQETGLELIASENYASHAVMAATGSVLTNKYAEGYPGKRYYGGCQFVDIGEDLAKARLRELYKCDDNSPNPYEANVQPHSGAQANMAVFLAFLEPGDSILGLDLSHGGHLTHGSPVNFSGKLFKAHHYSVNKETELLDYDAIYSQAKELRPKMIIGGASAYSHRWDFARLGEIAREVGAYFLVDMAHIAGLVAAEVHPSPIPHADFVTSTTHKTLRGPRGGIILSRPEHAKKINSAVFPGMQGGPLMHTILGKAVAFREALQPSFRKYQQQTLANAKVLAESIGTGKLRLVSGGTENHLALIDVGQMGLTGKEVEKALDSVHITVNKNTIPFESQSPFVTSGIRVGTPAITTRGMKEPEMKQIGQWITQVAANLADQPGKDRTVSEALLKEIQTGVHELCNRFPIYRQL